MSKTHLYDAETPRYIEFMARVDTLPVADLRKTLKYVIDDLFGDVDEDAEVQARDINVDKEWNAETASCVAETLDVHDLAPHDSDFCRVCGDCIPQAGDGWDGMCGNCADKAEKEEAK